MGVVLPGIGLGCSGRPPPPYFCREPSTGSCLRTSDPPGWEPERKRTALPCHPRSWAAARLATPSAACPCGPWGTTSASFRVTLHGSLCSGRLTPPPPTASSPPFWTSGPLGCRNGGCGPHSHRSVLRGPCIQAEHRGSCPWPRLISPWPLSTWAPLCKEPAAAPGAALCRFDPRAAVLTVSLLQ